ncbi:tRNA epoxyqueuosine(34) reductase QueG [Azospirillum doebereinerae]|uniref:Epoxyqueuosine reductase n=1 Tax=Azospirillum doebereinerae TaxID=92933 RepID=A0A3S0WK67_9PROT|nr:tRNA epoxyqueuosine(34) reductase QueG [Azospirillum doebereinerae]RUQ67519.1 tRNA epoxyqueuosine(34) reductase QueG [Azospirillum doebereinerae]
MAGAEPAPADPTRLRERIRDRALSLGFDAVGFAPAALGGDAREKLAAFLAEGRHGDMGWMAERADQRAHPQTLWAEARTVIALGTSYAPHEDPRRMLGHPERGIVSVYARNRDYHDLIKGRLKTLAQWLHSQTKAGVKVFVDTAPVMEKPLAERAGLGWQGKHTNLVSRDHGSWLFLGEVYTTLELPADATGRDRCGSCTACQTACPTDAFPAPYQLDARRCVSYLTIENKGPIPDALKPLMGNRIYGCDDCLSACPWNKFARTTREPAFLPRAELTAPRLADLAQLDDAGFRQVFSGSPVKRIGRDRFVRNVLVALGNSGDPRLRFVAEGLLDDPSDVVRDSARWAVERLGGAAV